MAKTSKNLTKRQYVKAIIQVAKITYNAAPLMVIMQLVGAVVSAVLPLLTTYFAALTTTALADAYAGNEAAGQQAIIYVLITAFLGIVMTAWGSLEQYITQLMRYRIEAGISDRMYEHFLSLDFWRYDDKLDFGLIHVRQNYRDLLSANGVRPLFTIVPNSFRNFLPMFLIG